MPRINWGRENVLLEGKNRVFGPDLNWQPLFASKNKQFAQCPIVFSFEDII